MMLPGRTDLYSRWDTDCFAQCSLDPHAEVVCAYQPPRGLLSGQLSSYLHIGSHHVIPTWVCVLSVVLFLQATCCQAILGPTWMVATASVHYQLLYNFVFCHLPGQPSAKVRLPMLRKSLLPDSHANAWSLCFLTSCWH